MRDTKSLDLMDIQMVGTEPLDRCCLAPSDHYGLFATFRRSKLGFKGETMNEHKKEYENVPKWEHGYRSINAIVGYRAGLTTLLALIALYLKYRWALGILGRI